MLAAEGEHAPIVFYDKISRRVIQPHFPTMQIVEAWAQPGITVATSIITAIDLINFPGPKNKLFYVWDLEWLGSTRMWSSLSEIFCNEELSLIARNQDHADVIENAFNRRPEYIMDNCGITQIKGILLNEKTK